MSHPFKVRSQTLSLALAVALCLNLTIITSAYGYFTNQSAVISVGQLDLTTRTPNQGGSADANTIRQPYGMTTDGTHLIVGDFTNNRVLIWNSIPTSSGVAADVVIGQTNMTNTSANQGGSPAANTLNGPTQVATDGTKLFVTDSTNNRVLIFNTIPTSNNASANVVIGQPDMATVTSGTSSTKLKAPEAVSYDSDSGKLLISDYNNHRVLIYNSPPTSNGAAANVVLGQANFDAGSSNRGGAAAGNTLSNPYNAHIFDDKLFVADASNNRILIWNTVPTSNGTSADLVIGQTSLTATSSNQGGSVAANTLSIPADILWDGSQLLVSDYNNQRVLIYDAIPTSNNASASLVIGQPDLVSSSKNQGSDTTTAYAYSLRNAAGGFGLTNDWLLVADTGNNRVLIYDIAPPTGNLTINDGADATSSSTLNLNLSTSDNFDTAGNVDMQISNLPDFSDATWESFSATKSWITSDDLGEKTIYMRFRDSTNNVSDSYSSTIRLTSSNPAQDPPGRGPSNQTPVSFISNSTGNSIIIIPPGKPKRLTVHIPEEASQVVSMELRVLGKRYKFTPNPNNPLEYQRVLNLPPLNRKIPYTFVVKYADQTNTTQQGTFVVKETSVPTKDINQYFRLVFGQNPSVKDWEYWANRLTEKKTISELIGAMQWQKIHGN